MDERLAAHVELAALSDDDFVDRVFRFVLRRPPDDEAREHWLAAILGLGAQELVGVDLGERDVPGMTTVRGDVRQLPFPSRSFDVVFCVSMLEREQDAEAPL